MNLHSSIRNLSVVAALLWTCVAGMAQDSQAPASAPPAEVRVDASSAPAPAPPDASGSAPATLTFQDALKLARKNSPIYRSAMTDFALAHEDKVQSRSSLLPNVRRSTPSRHRLLTEHHPASLRETAFTNT